jgi:hypothetical protein
MHVQLVPYPFGFPANAETDILGHYSACSPSGGRVAIQIWSPNEPPYATAFRYDVGPGERGDFVVHPRFVVPAAGGTISGTIAGDEFIGGDDEFGGRCRDTPCKVVDFGGREPLQQVEIRLRWNDASRDLAVYVSHEDYLPSHPGLGDRYCCISEVVAPYRFNADFDRFAIGFEHVAGGKPSSTDSQDFEVTIQPALAP